MTTPYIILSILFAAMLAATFLSGYHFGRRDGIRYMRSTANEIERLINNKGKA